MFYRGPNDKLTRALRRLFIVKCYDGDPDDPDCPIIEEKVIAWNQTDAIRRAGKPIVEQPDPARDEEGRVTWVTWDDKPLKIYSPKEGPTDERADEGVIEDTEGFDAKAPAKKKKKKKKK